MVGRPRGRGRGGRVGGRGRVPRNAREPVVEESVALSVTVEQVGGSQANHVGSESVTVTGAGGAGAGVGVAGEPADAAGVAAGVDQARNDRLADVLALLLERLPERVPAQAPGVPPVVVEQPRALVAGELSSYHRMMEQLQRLGTKFFCGGARPVESDEWRSRLERNFQSIRCPEEFRVDLAVHYLEGDAHEWWISLVARRAGVVWTWDEFRREFDLKYFPREARDRLQGEFLYLTQGSRLVREYEAEFNRLKWFAGRVGDTEHDLISAFMRGLHIDLINRCLGRKFESLTKLVECAAHLEEGLRQEASWRATVPGAPRRP